MESVFSTGKSLFKVIKCVLYPVILRRSLLIYKKHSAWIIDHSSPKFLGVKGHGRLESLEGTWSNFRNLGHVTTLFMVWSALPFFPLQEFSLWLSWNCGLSSWSPSRTVVHLKTSFGSDITLLQTKSTIKLFSKSYFLNNLSSTSYWFIGLLIKRIPTKYLSLGILANDFTLGAVRILTLFLNDLF